VARGVAVAKPSRNDERNIFELVKKANRMSNVPKSKPQITKQDLLNKINEEYPLFEVPKLLVVGIRGYYENTMGKPSANDRGIYDDAIFIVTPDNFHSFNANCDPSKFAKGIANLVPGIYPAYQFDLHRGKYTALCQRAGNVKVKRDNKGIEIGMFGINIHKGGYGTTSSLGCQTLYPTQWDDFISKCLAYAAKIYGKNFKKETYTYILLDQ
jgi:hypothetical protein